ncbi:MAG TPA: hypothetical protein VF774_27950, partial [Pseudoduganella sp.]
MNSINYSLNVDGKLTFHRPLLPGDVLFSGAAYSATWSGADTRAASTWISDDVLGGYEFGGYAGDYAYAATTITPAADGNYDLTIQSATGFSYTGEAKDADTQLWLYEGAFDPAHPLNNLVVVNDDIVTYTEDGSFGNLLSKLGGVSLRAGVNYVLVVSSRDAGLTGTAVVSFAEVIPVALPPLEATVPAMDAAPELPPVPAAPQPAPAPAPAPA